MFPDLLHYHRGDSDFDLTLSFTVADCLLSTLAASAWCLVSECLSASSFLTALAVGPIVQLLWRAGGGHPAEAPRQSTEALY